MKKLFRLLTLVVAMSLLATASVFAQTRLAGKVTDSDGQPLAGVTVMVKGTSNGTVTGADGSYSLRVLLSWTCHRRAYIQRSKFAECKDERGLALS